ncbi:MAG: hypothetical protein ABF821_13035, partial [Gluconacetobacter sp.]
PAQLRISVNQEPSQSSPKLLIPRTRSGRAIWNSVAITHLAELWKRLYSPTYIADYLGLPVGTIKTAAQRAGLPSRAGLTLLKSAPSENPLEVPESQVLVEQMIKRVCQITQTVFYQNAKDRRRQHYSRLGQLRIARSATGSIH